jgi:transcriptional regulator with XRE-family HTH domain
MAANKPVSEIDRHISSRLRIARHESGGSQVSSAETLGITFQQIQKYESGKNRISAGRLFELAELYGKPIEWFFPTKAKL